MRTILCLTVLLLGVPSAAMASDPPPPAEADAPAEPDAPADAEAPAEPDTPAEPPAEASPPDAEEPPADPPKSARLAPVDPFA